MGGHVSGQSSGEKKFDQKSKKGKENLAHSKMTVDLLTDGHSIPPSRVKSSELGVSNLTWVPFDICPIFLAMGKRNKIFNPPLVLLPFFL